MVGLWAMHPFEAQFPEVQRQSVLALHWSGLFGATFVNSYANRGFAAGVERRWWEASRGRLRLGAGFRLGAITGYDERLFELAGRTPVLPFAGLLLWADLGPLGVDAFYVYRAIALEAGIRF